MRLGICFEVSSHLSEFQVNSATKKATVEIACDFLPVHLWKDTHAISGNVELATRYSKYLTLTRWVDCDYSVFIGSGFYIHRDPRFLIDHCNKEKAVTVLRDNPGQDIILFNHSRCNPHVAADYIDRIYCENGMALFFDIFGHSSVGFFPDSFFRKETFSLGSGLFTTNQANEIDAVEKMRVFGSSTFRNGGAIVKTLTT